MRILGIESTCDETAAAVVADGWDVRSNVVATQVELHAKYRGVVPEIASRAHIENILPVVQEAMRTAACGFADLDAIAVAHRPGLIGSLLIGVTAAKTLAWSLGKPLIGVDHVHAHLYSVMLRDEGSGFRVQGSGNANANADPERDSSPPSSLNPEPRTLNPSAEPRALNPPPMPAIGLVVSGGHTALYDVRSFDDITLVGSTIDDAVGEAYDKVAAILGLGYPGGPIIDRLAQQGRADAVVFPRTMLARDSLDFSFSGLKTAVLYHVRGVPNSRAQAQHPKPPPTEAEIRDIAASFQAACVDVIVKKLRRAIGRFGAQSVIVGGGVSANRGLRAALERHIRIPVFVPPLKYCTDNAAMSAGLAHRALESGRVSALDLDAITYSQFK
jgi:N6-L-threonylcarbamoyladenine synthase